MEKIFEARSNLIMNIQILLAAAVFAYLFITFLGGAAALIFISDFNFESMKTIAIAILIAALSTASAIFVIRKTGFGIKKYALSKDGISIETNRVLKNRIPSKKIIRAERVNGAYLTELSRKKPLVQHIFSLDWDISKYCSDYYSRVVYDQKGRYILITAQNEKNEEKKYALSPKDVDGFFAELGTMGVKAARS